MDKPKSEPDFGNALAANRYALIEVIFKCTDTEKLDRIMGLYHPEHALDGWAQKQVYHENNLTIKRHMMIDFVVYGVFDDLDWRWALGDG